MNQVHLETRIKLKEDLSQRIKIYCWVEIVVSFAFVIWAYYNTFEKGYFDGGDVSWVVLILSSIPGLIAVRFYENESDDRARCFGTVHAFCMIPAHFLVAINYALGIHIYILYIYIIF